jgi:uncharacterized protein with beta-barrel porin domain
LALAAPAKAVVPNDNQTPEDIVDTAGGINGVGNMTVWNGDGTVGVCTGTLINPRTVLFAAHCVNSRAPEDYGSNSGGVPISFGFEVDNLPPIIAWLNAGFQTVTDSHIYNVNEIQYHPEVFDDIYGLGFLQADIALATLDTPATDIPTWALLFSALPSPASIDPVTGTGYHVTVTGYGATGNGTEGPVDGIDFRRRAAENMLGALASLDDVDAAIFGPADPALPQNLYLADFDDPAGTYPFDFNVLRDEPLPGEAITAGGDSGGPLILDAANNTLSTEDLVLGVLSGGSKYFSEQEFSTYGTFSFYQPLFLYWDYIAEANPYRYAAARHGSGNWENPYHWVSLQDPNYRIIDANGNVVTGIPDTPGEGPDGTSPDFGEVCLEGFGDICTNLETGEIGPVAGAQFSNASATVDFGNFAPSSGNGPSASTVAPSHGTAPGSSDSALPRPTIENGLPGATRFVPNNIDPDPLNGVRARYFDVTLGNPGTTWLSSEVEIDRLTVGGFARLDIRHHGELTVLTDYTQFGGTTNVDGTLHTGEALVLFGALTGHGTIDPTYLTVVSGIVAPDGRGTGSLTVQGDLVLASGAVTAFDLTRWGGDLLEVTGDDDNAGIASLGGLAYFSRGHGPSPRWNQSFQVVTAEGGVDGEFDAVRSHLGVLYPVLDYGANDVTVTLRARKLHGHVHHSNPYASAFAGALDQLRGGHYNSLYGLYGAIDVMDPDSLTATLSGFTPHIVNEAMEIGTSQNDMMLTLVSDRLSLLGTGRHQTGTFNIVGAPEMIGIAASNSSISSTRADQMSFARRIVSDGQTLGALPENMSGFISGGFENGRTATRFGSRNDAQANWHIAMGMEVELSNALTVGGATAFINGRSTLSGSQAQVRTNQAMAYASYRLGGGAYVAGLGSASVSDIETERLVDGGFETARFGNDTRASNYAMGAEAGINIDVARGFNLTPRAGLRYTRSEVDGYSEAGSEVALQVDSIREQRLEGRVGFAFQGETTLGHSWTVRPQLSADYVRTLGQGEGEMTVRFAEATGVPIVLPGVGYDTSWAEMRGGVSVEHGNLTLTTAFETDVARSDRRDDRAVAELSFRF